MDLARCFGLPRFWVRETFGSGRLFSSKNLLSGFSGEDPGVLHCTILYTVMDPLCILAVASAAKYHALLLTSCTD
jgi:hypothetical protein